MSQVTQLSAREEAVKELVLRGKSNKQIADALGISIRTVEFHLKNIYAKSHVSSRVEFILKLRDTTAGLIPEKLGESTVDLSGKNAENESRPESRTEETRSLSSIVSITGEEFDMKNLENIKYILVGVITALITGFAWLGVFIYYGNLTIDEVKACGIPLTAILTVIGLSVGLMGKRINSTLRRVFLCALFGTSLGLFSIIPLVLILVIPLEKLLERVGIINPWTMSYHVGRIVGAVSMITIWLVAGVLLSVGLLFLTIRRPAGVVDHTHDLRSLNG